MADVVDMKANIEGIKSQQTLQHTQYSNDMALVKQTLAQMSETLSNFKAIHEAITTLKSEQLENRRTFGKLFDRIDDLQKTKLDNFARSEIDILKNVKADQSVAEALKENVEATQAAVAERPTRREIFTFVLSISVIIGILFTCVNVVLSFRDRISLADVKKVIQEEHQRDNRTNIRNPEIQ